MALIAALVAIAAFAAALWTIYSQHNHPLNKLPGPTPVPLLGNIQEYIKSRPKLLLMALDYVKKYGKIFRLWVGNLPMVLPLDPNDLELILSNSMHITKSWEYGLMANWIGEGLITSGGAKWFARRKMLNPAFHFNCLENLLHVTNEKTQILVNILQKHAGKPQGVNITPLVTACAFDVICEFALGLDLHIQENEDLQFNQDTVTIASAVYHRASRPWLWPTWMYNLSPTGRRERSAIARVHSFTDEVIADRKAEREAAKVKEILNSTEVESTFRKRMGFLDILLETNEKHQCLSDEDIREETMTIISGGHDSTAMALTWILHYLSVYPEIQAKCVEELASIFHGDSRSPTMADLAGMKYLERVIKEMMRLRPPVHLIARKIEQPIKLAGYDIPPNSMVYINIFCIHQNPDYFPDPTKFDPERFSPEQSQGRHPYAYIPFSAGPRNCIGQKTAMIELKTVISSLLRNFHFESMDPIKNAEMIPAIVLMPLNGVQLEVTARSPTP